MSWDYKGNTVTPFDKFLYEISIYKIYNDRAENINSKFITSEKLVKFKKDAIFIKKDGYTLAKYIDLLGAPEDFIKNYCIMKKENEKRSRRV